jgi:hypothetical protein
MKNNYFNVRLSARPLVYLLILLILASCSTTKQLHQDKTKITTETSTHETTVSNSQVISNTRVIESQDTSVLLKGSELTASANFNNLLAGDTIFATGENLLLKTFYDSLTKTIKTQATAKPREVSFKYNKITERQELQTGTTTATKEEQQKQTVQSEKKVKSISRSSLPTWLLILIIIIIVSLLFFLFLKFKHIFKP